MKTNNTAIYRLILPLAALVLTLSGIHEAKAASWINTGSLTGSRQNHTATLLLNGKVLVAGGTYGVSLPSAELYDPATGTWTPTGAMTRARTGHTATMLPSGKV